MSASLHLPLLSIALRLPRSLRFPRIPPADAFVAAGTALVWGLIAWRFGVAATLIGVGGLLATSVVIVAAQFLFGPGE